MDFDRIKSKKLKYDQVKGKINLLTLSSYEKDFDLTYTHNSTAIEGNTLTLIETKVILEDRITVGGKSLREIYEVVNHQKAFEYLKKCIADNLPLSEDIAKDLHSILMENIIVGGVYRKEEVRITGAGFKPPCGNEMYFQIKNFYEDLNLKKELLNPIELAAWTHAEFVRIHPYLDGNGRTARLLMNYQLLAGGYLPVSISKEERLQYYDALDKYAANGDLTPFTDFTAILEEARLDDLIALSANS